MKRLLPLEWDDILFIDLELEESSGKLREIGAVLGDAVYRGASLSDLMAFAAPAKAVCGHNLISYDLEFLRREYKMEVLCALPSIDTLMLSALIRPDHRKHALHKDYKFNGVQRNDPVADALLCRKLLEGLFAAYQELPTRFREILAGLLHDHDGYNGFFRWADPAKCLPINGLLLSKIIAEMQGLICAQADLKILSEKGPVEFAMVLAIIRGPQPELFTPSWLLLRYPHVQRAYRRLRTLACNDPQCNYCSDKLDPRANLKKHFQYDEFRRFEGDLPGELPLQERAVEAALRDDSFLVIFPTGGGKSITFQLPAIIRANANNALTVVISPLVSLMKDQVDNLRTKHDITNATAINGLLSPLERQQAIDLVADGSVNLLYVAPESLRSNTILGLLKGRIIDRFVIDEAHCFSAWGQEFRVDYLYIAKFIKLLQETSKRPTPIPVSCFTATARKEVITDIMKYFGDRLGLEMQLFSTAQGRLNLSYNALKTDDREKKEARLLELLEATDQPAIIYVSRVKTSHRLQEFLQRHGFSVEAYNGKMDRQDKNRIQEAFLKSEIRIIVATSAFGMGVDKDNVAMVIHYEISNSLENYVQEAGRAGRDQNMQAKCVILFDENDLSKHFELLQGMKLNKKDIDQIWSGIKLFQSESILKSALEIARKAGWDTEMRYLETRVRAAVNALEEANYLDRGQNSPRIFSNSLQHKLLEQAKATVWKNEQKFSEKQLKIVDRMLQYMYGKENIAVDYMAESLAISMPEAVSIMHLFKQIGVLGDDMDLSARIASRRSKSNGGQRLRAMLKLEKAMINALFEDEELKKYAVNLRELNSKLHEQDFQESDGISIAEIRVVLQYWKMHKFLKSERTERDDFWYKLTPKKPFSELQDDFERRSKLATQVMDQLEKRAAATKDEEQGKVKFSLVDLKNRSEAESLFPVKANIGEYEKTLLYLNFIEAIELLDGLLVNYNRLSIKRTEQNNQKKYTVGDYTTLARHYERKIEQIHIVGEYAKRLLVDNLAAMNFTNDYFKLDYAQFMRKYFSGKEEVLKRPLTIEKFEEIFGQLDIAQLNVVNSKEEKILVTAGPGSGKTRVLVHKMASLLLLEDVKPEQFLMLAFSRPAAQEFRSRLSKLVPGLGKYIDIYTYHGFAFRLLGRLGDLKSAENVVKVATLAIREGLIPKEIVSSKSVIMLDEFQDVSQQEWDFLTALREAAEQPRIIAAGDDDQCIYEFRGASLDHMRTLIADGAEQHSLITNYRAAPNLVEFSNEFLRYFPVDRMKADQILRAKQLDNGHIRLVRYHVGNLKAGIVDAIAATKLEGTCALLTTRNEEAVHVHGLLRQRGIPAMLITEQDGFRVAQMQEFVWFTEALKPGGDAANPEWVALADWKKAVDGMRSRFAKSADLTFVLHAIHAFMPSPRKIHRLDWQEYCAQLRVEDVMFPEQQKVYVSTMHKAKGKEFDSVFLLLDNFEIEQHNNSGKSDHLHVLYVALTRAKKSLEIHCNRPYFDDFEVEGLERSDGIGGDSSDLLEMECGLKDIFLDHYKKIDSMLALSQLVAGHTLQIDQGERMNLIDHQGNVLVFWSQSMQEKLQIRLRKGYVLESASVAHIVFWKGENDAQPSRVILPRLTFRRMGNARMLGL